MSGYTPVFSEIYMGTLYGRWPAAAVWASLLPLCDKDGSIDISPQAISGLTGWPMDLLLEGIRQLSEPDPHSRTPEHDGKRLVLLDDSRPWGWRVVNHGKYREKARLLSKRSAEVESGKNAERMRDRRRPPETAADRPSDSDADSYTNSDKDRNGASAVSDPQPRKATKRGIGFPVDMTLTDERAKYAADLLPNVNAPELFASFRDHHVAKGTILKDWDAAWRTWCRNAQKWGYPMVRPTAEQVAIQKPKRIDPNGRVLCG